MITCQICEGRDGHKDFCSFGFRLMDLITLAERWLRRAEVYAAENEAHPSDIARTNALRWSDASQELCDLINALKSTNEYASRLASAQQHAGDAFRALCAVSSDYPIIAEHLSEVTAALREEPPAFEVAIRYLLEARDMVKESDLWYEPSSHGEGVIGMSVDDLVVTTLGLSIVKAIEVVQTAAPCTARAV